MPSRREAEQAKEVERSAAASTSAFQKALTECRRGLEDLISVTLEEVTGTLNLDPSGRKRSSIEPVFDSLLRKAVELTETMAETNIDAHRDSLKAQANVFKLKMEASRTASSVSMKNQAAEMQAQFTTQLQQKMDDLRAGGGKELKEALERAEELQQQLDEANKLANKSEEMLKTLRGLLQGKEAEVERAMEETEQFKKQVWETKLILAERGKEKNALQASLLEAAAEAERAILRNPETCKELVEILAGRLRAQLNAQTRGETEGSHSQLERLLQDMQSISQKLANSETENTSKSEELVVVKQQLANAGQQLANAGAKSDLLPSSGGDAAQREEMRRQMDKLTQELSSARQEVTNRVEEADSLRRDLSETLSRAITEAQRATMLSADECKRQVGSIAERLQAELTAAKRGEREAAHDQLHRLLSELSIMSKKQLEGEIKISEMEAANASVTAMTTKLKTLESDERKSREALAKALKDLDIKVGEHTQVSVQLKQLLLHYAKVEQERNTLRFTLERALSEMQVKVNENGNLADKLKQLLNRFKTTTDELVGVKTTLENTTAELDLHMDENAALRDKSVQLLDQYRSTYEKERTLRSTVKQQHMSLHAAYHRVKDVEMELQHYRGVAAEERDSLVQIALHALHQLRLHLGSVHALRPEATRPIDEALVVKKALNHSSSAHTLDLSPYKASTHKPIARLDAFMDKFSGTGSSPSRLGFLPPASPTHPAELPNRMGYRSASPPRSAEPLLTPGLPTGGPYRAQTPMSMTSLGGPVLPIKRGMLRVPQPPAPGSRGGLAFSDIGPIKPT